MDVRRIALSALIDIIRDKGYSNLVLNKAITKHGLAPNDRALLTKIVYGTLQNYYLLDWELKHHIKENTDIRIKLLLMMSLYQIRYLDNVPAFAAINEAVNLARSIKCSWASGFVNAILRKLSDNPVVPDKDKFDDELEYLALVHSYPYWLVKMWSKHYGLETVKKMLENSKVEPYLTLRVNTLKTTKEELLKNPAFKDGKLSRDALYYEDAGTSSLKEINDGLVVVQDESSQLSAITLNPAKNSKVLDMCAAPGTKTTHMAQIMENTGEIVAVDIHEHRVKLIEESLERLGVRNVRTMVHDSARLNEIFNEETFDYILLDAPCSGFGVSKRKPDILINSNQDKLDEIIRLQRNLLKTGIVLLKKGGYLVYSTCTLNRKENELQIRQLLDENKDIGLVSEKTIFPYEYNSDGFYIAKLQKVGGPDVQSI